MSLLYNVNEERCSCFWASLEADSLNLHSSNSPIASITSALSLSLPSLPLPTTPILSLTSHTSSSSLPTSSTQSSTTSSSPTSTLSSTTPSSSTSSTPTSATLTSQIAYETTSGGHTVTVMVDPSASPSVTHHPQTSSFLQNKAAAGVVFAIIGIVALVIIIMLITFTLRRRRNQKLLNEAISFDPGLTRDMERGSMEKYPIRLSNGSDRTTPSYRLNFTTAHHGNGNVQAWNMHGGRPIQYGGTG
ncbi:hypothetical protein AMATHDRAFT_1943 [Amanita thiersii Skay4041]|uniref:Mid2 domain-containing protein n=1 Tax=Amanita thiersii Skay4041 TaxID=703135 RepID=A0A2A9NQZ8_9AGAR|nr:hypothetical protein AMATHDRAFT_1943 [Amanita thiersii Skay4041]